MKILCQHVVFRTKWVFRIFYCEDKNMSSNRRVQVSAASRKLTRNRLSALPKKGDGIPQVLQAEEPQVAGRCSYERECPLATAEGGRCNCNPRQCRAHRYY